MSALTIVDWTAFVIENQSTKGRSDTAVNIGEIYEREIYLPTLSVFFPKLFHTNSMRVTICFNRRSLYRCY